MLWTNQILSAEYWPRTFLGKQMYLRVKKLKYCKKTLQGKVKALPCRIINIMSNINPWWFGEISQ